MKKIYVLLLIFSLGTTAFMTADHKKRAKVDMVVAEALLELNEEEKSALFYRHAEEVHSMIAGNKPSLSTFTEALKVHHSLKDEGLLKNEKLVTIIDFTLPSTKKRLWVIDLETRKVAENTVVSHGRNSGMNEVSSFSNTENSYQSSMGAFLTAETYTGKHGLSLRLDGLEKGVNDNARKRAIVMHTAAYANPSLIKVQGRLGRSLGCPAIPLNKIDLIKELSGGSLLYVHGEDENYSSKTRFKAIDSAYNALASENI